MMDAIVFALVVAVGFLFWTVNVLANSVTQLQSLEAERLAKALSTELQDYAREIKR